MKRDERVIYQHVTDHIIPSDSPLSKIQLVLLRAVGRKKGERRGEREERREGGKKRGKERGKKGEREGEKEGRKVRGREEEREERREGGRGGGRSRRGKDGGRRGEQSREQAVWLSELLRNSTIGRGMCMYACVRASCAYVECLDVVLSLENVQDRKSLPFFLTEFLSFFL